MCNFLTDYWKIDSNISGDYRGSGTHRGYVHLWSQTVHMWTCRYSCVAAETWIADKVTTYRRSRDLVYQIRDHVTTKPKHSFDPFLRFLPRKKPWQTIPYIFRKITIRPIDRNQNEDVSTHTDKVMNNLMNFK